MSAIRLECVWKHRGEGRRFVSVLRDISFAIEAGEVVLLLGPSGSGKTTLLGVVGGLLSADAGSVETAGALVDTQDQAARRRMRSSDIGFVFQRPSLLGGLTARENVLLMASLAGMDRKASEIEIDTLFESLGISALADHFPHQLSGGEEQRVGIARALIHRPAVLLADEPTGNLDAASGTAVAELMVALAVERRSAVLIATHDPRLERYASKRLLMRDGQAIVESA